MKKVQPYWIYEPTKTSDIEKKEEPSQLMPGGNPHWVDMVEVVRCKDCKHQRICPIPLYLKDIGMNPSETDYCSYGERRE